MNTIPLTFNERLCNCTVLGGKEKILKVKYPISVLLLGRNPGSYKEQSLEVLLNSGFENIITFETTKDNFKLEKYVQKFPQVKFILPSEKVSVGEMINLGMYECKSEYLLVLWDDLVIKNQIFNHFCPRKITSGVDSVIACLKNFLHNQKSLEKHYCFTVKFVGDNKFINEKFWSYISG